MTTEQQNQILIPRSESEGYLIVRVCRSRGPAGGPSSYRRCALGGNEAPPKEVRPSTTALIDKCGVLRGCLGGGTYISQSPRRANRGASAGWLGRRTYTHTHKSETTHGKLLAKRIYIFFDYLCVTHLSSFQTTFTNNAWSKIIKAESDSPHWTLLCQGLWFFWGTSVCWYSWIGHGLQSWPALLFLLWLSHFKTKTRFGFLIKQSGGVFNFSKQSQNELVRLKHVVFGDFGKKMIVFR